MGNISDNQKYNSIGMNKETYKILFDNETEHCDTSEKDQILDSITSFKDVEFNQETLQYKYKKDNIEITFFKLSDFIDTEKIKKELKTDSIKHKCHIGSILVSGNIKKENRILTGYNKTHNGKYLHSIVEVEDEKGQLYIMDYTMNIIMLKSQYLDLTQFEEIEAITDLEFKEDISTISNAVNSLSTKAYLTFRKEILRDLNKNEKIFEDDER